MRFYESLSKEHGHILVLLFLILCGWGACALNLAKGEDIVVGSFGALLALLRIAGKQNESNGTTAK